MNFDRFESMSEEDYFSYAKTWREILKYRLGQKQINGELTQEEIDEIQSESVWAEEN